MSDPQALSCVEIEPDGHARSAVIWLHGLGANGHDFEPIVPYLGLDAGRGVRFIFPHAPNQAVTINMGMVMPAWYDIRSPDLRRDVDTAGIQRSGDGVRALIDREVARGIDAANVILAGFSQGGAIALHVALRYPARLAGILALSTYLVLHETLEEQRSPANHGLPVFQAHGMHDPIVPIARGQASKERLEALGHPLEWNTYAMAHEVCPEEIRDVGSWLRARLPG